MWFEIDKKSGIPIIRQIYGQIREKILSGELKAGYRLPSTRETALTLHVSRNVILESYQMLLAEGYLISKPNIGTFVADGAVLHEREYPESELPEKAKNSDFDFHKDTVDFRSGVPALDLLPRKKLSQIKTQIFLDAPDVFFNYGSAEGRPELRNSICSYLQRTRGVKCHPDQIIVTTGSMQSFYILTRQLLKENSHYIIEDPLHIKIQQLLNITKANFYTVPVDEFGIKTNLLPKDISPEFIFVTPSHQYPFGGSLPIQRRIELINYARLKGCYIIEDDYDSEFHYEGPQVSSLQGLDPDLVIYAGTFSKVLFPSIRLGYMVLPWPLVMPCRELKKLNDTHTNVMEQLTISQFIDDRLLDRHIIKMKKVYNHRRDMLIDCLQNEFPGEIRIKGKSTGLHLVVEFFNYEFNQDLVNFLKGKGVVVYPVHIHSSTRNFPKNLLIMGYGHLRPENIKAGVRILHNGLKEWMTDSQIIIH